MTILDPRRRFTEVLTVRRPTGHTAAGDPTLGPAFTRAARIMRAKVTAGTEATDDTVIMADGELLPDDRVWFPEDNAAVLSASKKVKVAFERRALDGTITHYTVKV